MKYLILIAFSMVYIQSKSQKYDVVLNENPLDFSFNNIRDSIGAILSLNKMQNFYVSKGYVEFSYDSIVWSKNQVNVWCYIGQKYKIKSIESVIIDGKENKNFDIKTYTGKYDTTKWFQNVNLILNQMENNGYPFCKIFVKIKPIINNEISYLLEIDRGEYFEYDTFQIEGDNVLNNNFLQAYLGLRKGHAYNESIFIKSNDKLNQLPFLRSERNPLIAFVSGGKAKPYLYIKKRKSDQINGIIGMAPNSGVNNTKLLFTGEFTLKLNNLFKSAKALNINWRSFNARSQELKSSVNLPYLFYQPIGIDYHLEFLKFDTLFTNLSNQIGLQYYTSGVNGIKVIYINKSTNLNFVDTNLIRSSRQLPNINSVQIKQYGFEWIFNLLNNRFNPQKGWFIEGNTTIGTKEIIRDNQIANIKFNDGFKIYDSLNLKNTQLQYRLKVDRFIKISSNSTFKIGGYTSQIIAPQIYFNEIMREGGINSLKGFNEQSIFASNFNMIDIEYRYLIGSDSHIKLFWNGAYYEDKSYGRTSKITDYPWGFGVGGNFETSAGLLSIVYALGKEKNNKFDLRTGKIHFGISSYF
jgi:hypothetical protein